MKVMKNKQVSKGTLKGAAVGGPTEIVKPVRHSSSGKAVVAPKGRMPKVK